MRSTLKLTTALFLALAAPASLSAHAQQPLEPLDQPGATLPEPGRPDTGQAMPAPPTARLVAPAETAAPAAALAEAEVALEEARTLLDHVARNPDQDLSGARLRIEETLRQTMAALEASSAYENGNQLAMATRGRAMEALQEASAALESMGDLDQRRAAAWTLAEANRQVDAYVGALHAGIEAQMPGGMGGATREMQGGMAGPSDARTGALSPEEQADAALAQSGVDNTPATGTAIQDQRAAGMGQGSADAAPDASGSERATGSADMAEIEGTGQVRRSDPLAGAPHVIAPDPTIPNATTDRTPGLPGGTDSLGGPPSRSAGAELSRPTDQPGMPSVTPGVPPGLTGDTLTDETTTRGSAGASSALDREAGTATADSAPGMEEGEPQTLGQAQDQVAALPGGLGSLLGRTVRDPAGAVVGTVDDLLLEPTDGSVAFAVVALQDRQQKVVVPWPAMALLEGRDDLFVNMPSDRVAELPGFDATATEQGLVGQGGAGR